MSQRHSLCKCNLTVTIYKHYACYSCIRCTIPARHSLCTSILYSVHKDHAFYTSSVPQRHFRNDNVQAARILQFHWLHNSSLALTIYKHYPFYGLVHYSNSSPAMYKHPVIYCFIRHIIQIRGRPYTSILYYMASFSTQFQFRSDHVQASCPKRVSFAPQFQFGNNNL